MKGVFLAKRACGILTFIAVALISACSRHKELPAAHTLATSIPSEYKADGARLTSTEAIQLAKAEALRQGINLRHFNEPHLEYYASRTNWFLLFWGKSQRYTGDHFSVYVNDHTRKTSFIGGR